MTNLVKLIRQWEELSGGVNAAGEYKVVVSVKDAARIAALVEMYPRRTETELISELLSAALDELEIAMPYRPGTRVVSEDEDGNPVFEDIGPTPRFLDLSRKHAFSLEHTRALESQSEARNFCATEIKSMWCL